MPLYIKILLRCHTRHPAGCEATRASYYFLLADVHNGLKYIRRCVFSLQHFTANEPNEHKAASRTEQTQQTYVRYVPGARHIPAYFS